jgi:ribosomal protein L7/L12
MSEPPRAGTLDQVRRRLAEQAKMFAVKLYRDKTGAGFAEAKDAIERIRTGRAPAPPPPAPLPPIGTEARAVGEALRAGNDIEAIRLYRAATGVGLKEAKDAIDAILAEKRAGARPAAAAKRVVERRRIKLSPVLVLLVLAALFGTIFGLVLFLFSSG